jgi:hypothetical protein
MPDFHIGDVIQEQGDEDNTKFVVTAINKPKSTYTLLFESDEELFDGRKDILFRIPKDGDTNYYVIEINRETINSYYKKIEKQFEKNIEVRKNSFNIFYGGKRRKSIRKRRVKKQYTKRFKKHNSRKYK